MSDEHPEIFVKVSTYYPSRQSHQTLSTGFNNENNLCAGVTNKFSSPEVSPPNIQALQDTVVEPEPEDEADHEDASFAHYSSVSNEKDFLEDLASLSEKEPINSCEDAERRVLSLDSKLKEIQNKITLRAIERLDRLLARKPGDSKTLYQKGCAFLVLERYEEAKECLQKAHDCLGKNLNSLGYNISCVLAECYLKTEQNDKAQEMFSNLAESFPKNGKAFYGLGMCFSVSGEFRKAIEQFQRAADINPDSKEIQIGIARCEKCIGDSFLKEKRWKDAINPYTRAINANKDNVMFYCKRGSVYFLSGDKRSAYMDFERATQLYKTKRSDVLLAKDNTEEEAIFVEKIMTQYMMSG